MKILLVEDNQGDARLLDIMLREVLTACTLTHADTLGKAISHACLMQFDIILLDLSLPDSQGSSTFWSLHDVVSDVPIVVMTGHDDEMLATELAQAGAQDYLVKGSVDGRWLLRVMRYAIERKRAELELRQSEAKVRALYEAVPDLLLFLDLEGRFLECKPAKDFQTHIEPEHFLGKTIHEALPEGVADQAMLCLEKAVAGRDITSFEYQMALPQGVANYESRFIRASEEQVLCIVRDISESKRTQQQLHFLAHYDTLTGLPNRLLFNESLQQAQTYANRTSDTIAVMFIDLDRFKNINDTLGHGVGDKLLQQVGSRVSLCIRESDTVARMGGDEFAVVLVNVREERDAAVVAEKIIDALRLPFMVDDHEVFVGASIGITFYRPGQDDRDVLLEKADVAMYHAKERGRNNYQFYSSEMDEVAYERLVMENHLRHALDRNEFILYYQPQIAVEGGRVTAVETLLRWQHPERGLVAPGEFISLLEESGLIVPVGKWVLKTSCQQGRAWYDAGTPVRVAVNLSVRQFKHPGLVADVAEILAESGLPPELLELELTESMFMDSATGDVNKLTQLKALGVSLAIDDFGSGASSLAYLKDFPVDTLKICQSFVLNLPHNNDDSAIASAVLGLAQAMNFTSVAEGVENAQQADFLRERRCDYFQGFLFSKPLPVEELDLLLNGSKLQDS
ncbi:putative bifunctional diguanylate cyclase/phosphodiesterase [Methylotenera sp.]|uniref:putative bifunctional diguanylate cyclase/phosphodiesterase n=1 Tax=Methylotenera sp. TaxID=2051956 RepID=UPI002EDB403C